MTDQLKQFILYQDMNNENQDQDIYYINLLVINEAENRKFMHLQQKLKILPNLTIDVQSLLEIIKSKQLYKENSQILYQNQLGQQFDIQNQQQQVKITLDEIQQQQQITLIIRASDEEQKQETSNELSGQQTDNNNQGGLSEGNQQEKRVKERSISEAIKKVHQWRTIRQQKIQKNGIDIKCNYTYSAERTGIPKKTLEDYKNQISKGYRLGFNFKDNQNNKMGILRDFNKQHSSEFSKFDESKNQKSIDQILQETQFQEIINSKN